MNVQTVRNTRSPGRKPSLTEAEEKALCDLYRNDENQTATTLAAMFRVHPRTVYNVLKRRGITGREPDAGPDEPAKGD